MRPEDWTRNFLILAILICLGFAWKIFESSSDPGDGRTGALALTLIAAVLTGGLLVDYAHRGNKKDDPPPPPKGGKNK